MDSSPAGTHPDCLCAPDCWCGRMTSRRWRAVGRWPWLPHPRHKLAPEHAARAEQLATFKRVQEQFERVVVDLLGSLRRGDNRAARSVLAPDVTWQGLRPEWRCEGAAQVLDGLREGLASRRDITAIEVLRGDTSVVFGSRGPAFDAIDDEPLDGQIYNVYTFEAGRIARIQDVRTRAEALALAGIDAPPSWS